MRGLAREPGDLKLMTKINQIMELLKTTPVQLELWQMQNDYYLMAKTVYRDYLEKEKNSEEGAGAWLEAFRKLGEQFHFDLDAVLRE